MTRPRRFVDLSEIEASMVLSEYMEGWNRCDDIGALIDQVDRTAEANCLGSQDGHDIYDCIAAVIRVVKRPGR